MKNYFKDGSWNIICDVCGFRFKAEEVIKRWDGLYVCKEDFEVRHPLDFLRVRQENVSVPYVRPEPPDQFIFLCTFKTSQGVADMGTADCARADYSVPNASLN